MNLATRIHDQAIRDTVRALRYEAGLSKRALAHLRGLERDILVALADAGDITTQKRLKALLSEVKAAAGDRYEAAQSLLDEEMPQFAQAQAANMVEGLNGLLKVDIFNLTMTSDQARAIASNVLIEGAPSADWWAAQEADTVRRFGNIVRGGMMRGATGDEMAREVRDLMGTSMRNAQSLVRSSVITTNNAAHMAVFEANSDIVKGVQWVSTLDVRSCLRCANLDSKTWKLDESHPIPALHWGCRCAIIAQTKSWEELTREFGGNTELGRMLDQMPEGTRASMNGQVAASTTYEDWLSRQDAKTQTEILGPARQRLYNSGKLTLRDLTDQSGHELTLKELAKK